MRWTSSRSQRSSKTTRFAAPVANYRPLLEMLEDRLAPALINWVNRADLTDHYGANTALARQIIDTAILQWETVIDSFNYKNVGKKGWAPHNSFDVTFVVEDLAELGHTSQSDHDLDGDGKPFRATISLDNDADALNPDGKHGWYFDPTPGDDFEFKSLVGPFAAVDGPNGTDFYSAVQHELGHALGMTIQPPNSNIHGRLTAAPHSPPDRVFHFLDGTVVLMDTATGLHLWDKSNPNDLMVPNIDIKTRRAISDLDARILADSYGYTINWSYIPYRSFIATFDPATKQLNVIGDLGTSYEPNRVFDDIKLDVFTGGYIYANVNGLVKRVAQDSVSNVVIFGRDGNDEIRIGGTAARQAVDVWAGNGDNRVYLSHSAHNLDTIQGDVYVREAGGRTSLNLHDENGPARTFSAFGTNVNFTGSAANIQYRYANTAFNLDAVVLRGGDRGNTFNLDDAPDRQSDSGGRTECRGGSERRQRLHSPVQYASHRERPNRSRQRLRRPGRQHGRHRRTSSRYQLR